MQGGKLFNNPSSRISAMMDVSMLLIGANLDIMLPGPDPHMALRRSLPLKLMNGGSSSRLTGAPLQYKHIQYGSACNIQCLFGQVAIIYTGSAVKN